MNIPCSVLLVRRTGLQGSFATEVRHFFPDQARQILLVPVSPQTHTLGATLLADGTVNPHEMLQRLDNKSHPMLGKIPSH